MIPREPTVRFKQMTPKERRDEYRRRQRVMRERIDRSKIVSQMMTLSDKTLHDIREGCSKIGHLKYSTMMENVRQLRIQTQNAKFNK